MNHYHLTGETAYEYLKRAIANHKTDECLIWPFAKSKEGYGYLLYPETRRYVKAHRLAYKLAFGEWPIPQGRHLCGNARCFNPFHIAPGTDADNMADKVAMGRVRGAVGSRNAAAKITEAVAVQIRLDSATMRQYQLCEKYGLCRSTVRLLLQGKRWGHVEMPPTTRRTYKVPNGEAHRDAKLTEEDVLHIRSSSLRRKELATMYGVDPSTISHIIAGRKWKHMIDNDASDPHG